MDIRSVDKNFVIKTTDGKSLKFYDPINEPMVVEGLKWFYEDGKYVRLKKEDVDKVNEGVSMLSEHTSGGKVRFVTDSTTIAIKAKLLNGEVMPHMPQTGSGGFDIYFGTGKDKKFVASAFRWEQEDKSKIDTLPLENLPKEEREVTINFPLYNGIKELYIGLDEDAVLKAPKPYDSDKAVMFYGSSITQGGCASRPGNMYSSIIGRWLDVNTYNLGFSGSARGELYMAELICGYDMSCFVMDYDHNAPTLEHLKETHEPFFKYVRERHPELPIILVSRPDKCDDERINVILNTYNNAVKAGDKNVYFINGKDLFTDKDRDACTVDGTHPNDLGFYRMAEAIAPVVKKALGL
ncbi:MAG: SGNH/GDSL hydrolase family protein [Clostridia bacterium]|nr:SGNH/GDSL hydrolase family protein [Clostridia bacterium]